MPDWITKCEAEEEDWTALRSGLVWSVPCGPRGIKSNYAIYGRKGNYRIGIKVHSGSCGSCEIYAAFVLIKFLSLRINSETQKNKKENWRERRDEQRNEACAHKS